MSETNETMTVEEFRREFPKVYPESAWTVGLETHPEDMDGPCCCDECIEAMI